uniref:Uncharacterized protein n=1 Tax=Dulem virus 38 TaxID=3145756 RepID=A0AAU8B368_9CAUD
MEVRARRATPVPEASQARRVRRARRASRAIPAPGASAARQAPPAPDPAAARPWRHCLCVMGSPSLLSASSVTPGRRRA